MAAGDGLLSARDTDCADCGGGDYHHCGGGVPDHEKDSFCQGCGWREGQGGEEDCAKEDSYEGCEGLSVFSLLCFFSSERFYFM